MSDNIIDSGKFASAPNSSADVCVWADYCEIACLLSKEHNLSDEEIYRSYYLSKDLEPEDVNQKDKDMVIAIIQDALSQVDLRNKLLKTKYPFQFNRANTTISLKGRHYFEQVVYIALLYASNLKYVKEKRSNILTSGFEKISLHIMRSILPNATLKIFGSSNTEECGKNDKFSGQKLKERIPELARLIFQEHIEKAVSDLDERNKGDNGLDIAGFINLKDDRSSHPLFFAQCTCSKEEWSIKQLSTLRNKWGRYIDLADTSVHNFIIVPFMYMDNEKNWTDKQKITQNVMIDRLRIMNAITRKHPFEANVLEAVKKDIASRQ